MLRILFLTPLFYILVFTKSFSQPVNVDSLLFEAKHSDTSIKAELYNDISRAYWYISPDSSLKYAELAYEFAVSQSNFIEEMKSLNNFGVICDLQGNYSSSLGYYFQIIDLAEELGIFTPTVPNSFFLSLDRIDLDQSINQQELQRVYKDELNITSEQVQSVMKMLANAYVNIGIVYGRLSQLEKSMVSLQQSLRIRNEIGDEKGVGVVLFNLGTVYVKLSRLDLAKQSYTESIEIRHKHNDIQGIANGYLAMGELYNNYNKLDSACYFLLKAKEAYIKLNNKSGLARSMTFIGEIYGKTNKKNEAIKILQEALSIRKHLKDKEGVAIVSINLGNIYQELGDNKKALESYQVALSIGNELIHNEIRSNSLLGLAKLYEKQNMILKAYNAFKEYHGVTNLVKEQVINTTISQYKTLFQVDRFDKENAILKKENEIKSLEIKRQKTIQTLLIIIGMLILLSSISLFFLYKRILKANRNLVEFNHELETRVEERTKDLREALKIAEETNNLKNAFLSNISHEIRTPLNGIMGFNTLLANEIDHDEDALRYTKEITSSSNRLMQLLNDLIDFSRIESSNIRMRLVSCNINQAIEEGCNKNSKDANEQEVELNINLSEIPNVIADWDNLVRVFSIIINNAIKYSPKGKVSITTNYLKDSKLVEVSVVDTGVGIDPDYLPYVFEPFRQESTGLSRMFQGAGLGLPLAKKLLQKMGGDIELTSKKGHGTKVKVKFMAADSEEDVSKFQVNERKKQKAPERTQVTRPRKAKVLIVEENSYTRFYLQALLKRYANVSVARDGNEALSILADSNNQTMLFDLVIVDSMIPEPWKPATLLKEIFARREGYKKRPFVIQVDSSIWNKDTDEKLFFSYGYSKIVKKPIDKDKLLGLLRELSPQKKI